MARQIISLGTGPNTQTGTDAREGGRIINENFEEVYGGLEDAFFEIGKVSLPDTVLKYGEVSVDVLDVSVLANAFAWRINLIETLTPPAFSTTLDPATAGYFRYDLLVGWDDGTYHIKKGDEGEFSADIPNPDPGTIALSILSIVGDEIVSEEPGPIVGDVYVKKQESVDFIVNYGATTVIEQIGLTDEKSSISLTNAVTDIKSIQVSGEFLRPGKPHFVKNRSGHNVTIWHNAGTGNVKYFFPNASNFIIKPNEVIEFNLNGNDSSAYKHEFVGVILDLSNKADLVSGKVPASQLPSYVDDILEGYLLSNVFYLESGHTTVIPAETGKIYIDLTTGQENKEYRYSGSAYIQITNGLIASTDDVVEGSVNKYSTLATVMAYVLTGISFATGTAITATDTILSAFGKLQKQITNLSALFVVKDRLLENASVTGSFALDYGSYELWNLVLSGNTTFSESNLEPKTIIIRCTGNYALTFPSGWSAGITGVYDGTLSNVIVVQNFKSGLYKVSIIQPD